MQQAQTVPPTAMASGIPYERLVKLFQVVQERASKASAADMLNFLQEDLSATKYDRLSSAQRERMQHTLRSMQEYALEVWRLSPYAATQTASAAPFSLSGVYAALRADSGSFVLQNLAQPNGPISGSFVPVATPTPGSFAAYRNPDSGLIALFAGPSATTQVAKPPAPPVQAVHTEMAMAAEPTALDTGVTGAYAVVSAKTAAPMPKKSVFRRAWDSLCSAFGKNAAVHPMPIPREAGE